jgi:acetyltransferase
MVSLGERADVDFGDLLDYLASDAETRSILLYIESLEAPRKFMSAARAAARNKPVIVVKAGRAGKGCGGALRTPAPSPARHRVRRGDPARRDAARRHLAGLFMAAETLARISAPTATSADRDDQRRRRRRDGRRRAALAGVPCGLSEATRARLDAALPPTWSHGNPIDIIGDAPVERYVDRAAGAARRPRRRRRAASCTRRRRSCAATTIARACAPIVRRRAGACMACWLGDAAVAEARASSTDAGIADYATPEEAVRAFAMLATYRATRRCCSRRRRERERSARRRAARA